MPSDFRLQITRLRSRAAQYAFALLVLAASTGFRILLNSTLGDSLPYIFYFVAMAVVSLTCDLYPAILELVGSAVLANIFFIVPQYHLSFSKQALLSGVLYLISASAIVYAGQAYRRSAKALQEQQDWLHTTVTNIGDAVIATDANGLITLMNKVAETLTGWSLVQSRGKPLAEVFRILNQETRQPVENPMEKVRRLNRIVGLANHTILVSKSGEEIAIDDSGAPMFAPDGSLSGVVLVFRDVTKQRNAQKAIAELAAIVEYSGDAIATKNLDGIIQTWNASAERLFGYKPEEIIGKPVTILIPPERLDEEIEILTRIRAGRPFERLETVRLRKDGTPVHVSLCVSPMKDATGHVIGASKVLHDITELVDTRAELVREKEFLATTIASIGDAVIATDADGMITLMNPIAEKLTEWKSEEALGRPLTEVFRIINQETRKSVESPVEKVRRLNHVVGLANHTVLISKSGQEFAIDDSGAPIRDAEGKLAGIVLIFRDVTQQRALELALKSNERLALAGRLSASIAHEIHNPLDIVSNSLFLLDQRLGTSPQTRLLIETAQKEVKRVAEISKNMLSLHRESRAASMVNLYQLLQGVVSLVQETIAKGRRKIELVPGFDGEVEAFPSELRQVFTNVIKNAVEATKDGGNIKIYSEQARQSGQDGVIVRIIDDGVGIPEQLRSRLFSPFVTTKEESGTGLGLWVSRSIVEKHGGNIQLHGSTRKNSSGTTVAIFLPLRLWEVKTFPGLFPRHDHEHSPFS
jgi:PAS domain S-box-containing protein